MHRRPPSTTRTDPPLPYTRLFRSGWVLGPRHVGLLAAVGRATISARPKPRVVIMSTGTELRDPGTPLGHDSIYDSNSYMLAAAVRADRKSTRLNSSH